MKKETFTLFLILATVGIGGRTQDDNCRPKIKIGIVGAGLGGTSCANFIRELFQSLDEKMPKITIFESGDVGGRLSTVKVAGYEYEAGGDLINPRNLLMDKFVKTLGLKKRYHLDAVNGVAVNQFSILEKPKKLLFEENDPYYAGFFRMSWHYGIATIIRVFQLITSTLTQFKYIYNFLEAKGYADSVESLLNHMQDPAVSTQSGIYNDTSISFLERLNRAYITEPFTHEMATAVVRGNYGQMPESVHALVGVVALSWAESGLWSVDGGNRKVPELLLHRSKAQLVRGYVNKVAFNATGGNYRLHYNSYQSLSYRRSLHNEGFYGGTFKEPKILNSQPEMEDCDIVVIATPLTKDKSCIKFEGLINEPTFPGRFHRTVATLVHGELDINYLGLESESASIFFVNGKSNINSIGLQGPVTLNIDSDGNALMPIVWKVISQKPLSNPDLDRLFLSRKEVKHMDWLAYPHYEPRMKEGLGYFRLHNGLFHLNAIENAVSAMEMAALGAQNVANGVLQHYLSLKPDYCNGATGHKETKVPKHQEL